MTDHSAGLLLYRHAPALQVFIGHMGGPYWAKKDAAAWSIPKGLYESDEEAITAARREFEEEIGVPAPDLDYRALPELRLSSGKRVVVFTALATSALSFVASNTFEIEWPPRSGRMQSFPEIDRAQWFDLPTAREKLVKGQLPALDALVSALESDSK